MSKINFVAPCGIYCGACRQYLLKKKNLLEERGYKQGCDGCRIRNKNCTFIKKDCSSIRKKKYNFCYECEQFPCEKLYKLDNIYVNRYSVSPIKNLKKLQKLGLELWFKDKQVLYKCPKCGGEICIHDSECFDCGNKINPNLK